MKEQLLEKVQANYENVRRGYVAAIVNAANDPTDEAFANVTWYENRLNDLGILRLKVEANVEEDK